MAFWRHQGIQLKRIAINVSAQHLHQGELALTVANALERHQLPGSCLEIELTESSFISNLHEAKSELKKLKALGVSIALDDFGTGYSALSYLTKLPIDVLKIDASFTAKVPDEYGNSEIVTAIVAMAKALKLKVVAEGVEKQVQKAFLQQLNCHYLQGYLFCRPLNESQWLSFYQAHTASNIETPMY